MKKTCTVCGTSYYYSPADPVSFTLEPPVCSGKCFQQLLMEHLETSDQFEIFSDDNILLLSKSYLYRNKFEEQVAIQLRRLSYYINYEQLLFKPCLYVPDFMVTLPSSNGVVFLEAKGIWADGAHKKVRAFREWLQERGTDIYLIDAEIYRRIASDKH